MSCYIQIEFWLQINIESTGNTISMMPIKGNIFIWMS